MSQVLGALQIGLVAVEDEVAYALEPGHEDLQIIGKVVFWMAVVVIAAAVNLSAWIDTPPPVLGSVTMKVVRSYSTSRGTAAAAAAYGEG